MHNQHAYSHDRKYSLEIPPVPGNMPTAPGIPNNPTQAPYHLSNSFTPRSGLRVQGFPEPWSSGLCHCCDDAANCFITCFCPCITFGQISEIVNRGEDDCASRGTVYGLLVPSGFACLYSCFYRSKLRGQYNLEEAPCTDCLVHFCCEVCALCQEYRELKTRGFDMGIGWEANMSRQISGVTVAPVVEMDMSR